MARTFNMACQSTFYILYFWKIHATMHIKIQLFIKNLSINYVNTNTIICFILVKTQC